MGPGRYRTWFAGKALGVVPTSLRLAPAGAKTRRWGRGGNGGHVLEGWKVGTSDRSSKSPAVAVAVNGAVYQQHRRGWRPATLRPQHLGRMAEVLSLTSG